jgi:hypothetical protein
LTCGETWIAIGGFIVLALICSVVMLLGGWRVSGIVMAVLIIVFVDHQFITRNLTDWVVESAVILLFCGMQTFVLCLFLKEKFFNIGNAVFLTFFVVTALQLALSSKNDGSLFEHPEAKAHSAPRIVHLILDEHIGIEGIPTDVEGGLATKRLITQFYLNNGFYLFGGAFSRYFNTQTSLGNMLNFTTDNTSTALINGLGPYILLRNKYFELLSEKDYHIEVLSPGWIDFCVVSIVIISRCIERDWGNLSNFSKLELPISQKLKVLYGRYVTQSNIVVAIIDSVVSPLQSNFPALTTSVARWTWALDPERTRTDSLNTLADLNVLWSDVMSLPRGTVLLAHLLIPHHPYVALTECSIRLPNKNFLWTNRTLLDHSYSNTVESRKERYQQYLEQLECLYLRLNELFDRMRAAGIFDDSIIIIHGDHGSKIVLTDPTSENQHLLSKQDLADGFSTLFAVKLPGTLGGYDPSHLPLEQLFANFAFEAGLSPANILPEKSEPYVYLSGGSDNGFTRIPYVPPN